MRATRRIREQHKRERIQRNIALTLLIITILFAMFVTLYSDKGMVFRLYDPSTLYRAGELADEDFYATRGFEYVDHLYARRIATERQKEVLPLFTYQIRPTVQSKRTVDQFIQTVEKNKGGGAQTALHQMGIVDSQNISREIALLGQENLVLFLAILRESGDHVLDAGLYSAKQLAEVAVEGYEKIRYNGPAIEDEEDLDIEEQYTKANLPVSLTNWLSEYGEQVASMIPLSLVADTLKILLTENVIYDRIETMSQREEVASAVQPPVFAIERGTKIISRDTVVTESQVDMLHYMQEHAFGYSILELVGRLLFLTLVSFVSVIIFIRSLQHEQRIYLYLIIQLVTVLLSLIATLLISIFLQNRSLAFIDGYLPFFFAPLFLAHISSRKRLGYVTAFLLACYATLTEGATLMTFFFVLAVNSITLYFFQYSTKRLQDLFSWLFAALATAAVALVFSPLGGVALHSLIPLIISVLVNITVSMILVEAFVPVVERLFNIPTAYRLNELAFSDSPAIERLASVAQGTYNHSRYVSELAYQAAKTIGANAMLARVGGLYHDIGKADHPEYFVENQSAENKHDDIKPSLSVAVIKSHVKLGYEKGREIGLPNEVLDIISQHHGNDVIHYFYTMAAQQAKESGVEVSKDDYSYSGQPPTSIEAAIVMLADIVEAATRTMKQPTYSKYQKLVHSLIMGKIEREQLNDSGLSLTDISKIEESFVQTLIGRDHKRIEYPEEE